MDLFALGVGTSGRTTHNKPWIKLECLRVVVMDWTQMGYVSSDENGRALAAMAQVWMR